MAICARVLIVAPSDQLKARQQGAGSSKLNGRQLDLDVGDHVRGFGGDPRVAQLSLDDLGNSIGTRQIKMRRQSRVINTDGGNGGYDPSFQDGVVGVSAPARRPASKAASSAERTAQTACSWKSRLSALRVLRVSRKRWHSAICSSRASGAALGSGYTIHRDGCDCSCTFRIVNWKHRPSGHCLIRSGSAAAL